MKLERERGRKIFCWQITWLYFLIIRRKNHWKFNFSCFHKFLYQQIQSWHKNNFTARNKTEMDFGPIWFFLFPTLWIFCFFLSTLVLQKVPNKVGRKNILSVREKREEKFLFLMLLRHNNKNHWEKKKQIKVFTINFYGWGNGCK